MDDTFEIALTTPELMLIGALLELAELPIEEGSPESTPEDYRQVAREKLEIKSYIRASAEDGETLALDQTVAMMVAALGLPQYGLMAHTFRERQVEPKQVSYFGVGALIVEQARNGERTHILTALRTPDVALQRLSAFLGLTNQPPAQSDSFRIAAADMAQVPYVIAGGGAQDGELFLREAGAPAKAAARLAAALDNPVRQSVIRAVLRVGDGLQEIGRLTLLEEVYGLWLIAPNGANDEELIVAPVTRLEASDAIRELAYRVIPLE